MKQICDFLILSNYLTYKYHYIFHKAIMILLSFRLLINQTLVEAIVVDYY